MAKSMRFGLAACLALCGVGLARLAQADSVTYELENMVTATQGQTDWSGTGYGGIRYGGNPANFVLQFGTTNTTGASGSKVSTFMQVDLQQVGNAIPANATNISAVLYFDISEVSGAPTWTFTSFDANGTLENGWEDPTTGGLATYGTVDFGAVSTGTNQQVNVTDLLTERLGQELNPQWFGLHIAQTGTGWARTPTAGDTDAANVRLVVTYDVPAPVPEPATMSLLGIGLVGFAVQAYRRRLKS